MRFLATALFASVVATGCASKHESSDPPQQQLVDVHPEHGGSSAFTCASDNAGFVCPRAAQGLAISPAPVALAGASDEQATRVAYGSYLVNAASDCASCHSSPAGFLAGGNPFPVDHAGHVVYSRNLTPDAKTGMQLTEEQFVTAIRTGTDFHQGAAGILVVMPWPAYRWASDGDLRAIYAYLRAIPAAQNAVPADNKAGLGLPPAIPFTGVYTDGEVQRPLPPDDGSLGPNYARGLAIQPLGEECEHGDEHQFARGSYLANSLSECSECHTQGEPGAPPGRTRMLTLMTQNYMTGGNVFTVPPPLRPMLHEQRSTSANLTGAMNGFFHEEGVDYGLFAAIIRTQSHVDENPPRPLAWPMPADKFKNQLDDDLHSIFTYGVHVPPNHTSDVERQDWARWCAADSDCNAGETCHIDADPSVGNECVGKACSADIDCETCQTCTAGACTAPTADSACIMGSY